MNLFPESDKLMSRLLEDKPLSPEELKSIVPDLRRLTSESLAALRDHLNVKMMLLLHEVVWALDRNRTAIEGFDRSSRKLTKWLIGLTVVLAILTAAQILIAVIRH